MGDVLAYAGDLHSTRFLAKQESVKEEADDVPGSGSPTSTTRHYCQKGQMGPAVRLLGPSRKPP